MKIEWDEKISFLARTVLQVIQALEGLFCIGNFVASESSTIKNAQHSVQQLSCETSAVEAFFGFVVFTPKVYPYLSRNHHYHL